MSEPDRGGPGRHIKRALLIALLISVALIALIVVLDWFGSQPQPFRYLIH